MTIEMYKLARPKLNGYPISILNGKPQGVVNPMVLDLLGELPQFVGELVVGHPTAPDCYERSKAFVDDPVTTELFVFWVYDLRTTNPFPLNVRLEIAQPFIAASGVVVQYVEHELIESPKQLADYRERVLKQNFTGIVLREPYGVFGHEDEEITSEVAIV